MSDINFISMQPEISHQAFIQLAAERFPAVATDIFDEECAGLIHLQVASLTRYTNKCLAQNDLVKFERILRFVDYVLPKVDDGLDNALYVSFVEMLHLDGDNPTRQAGLRLLSPWQLEFYLGMGEFFNGTAWREKVDAELRLRP